ncbi:hypothetical protein RYX36_029093, partial [Vicia faba]
VKKIQASVRKALLPRFENKIKEGSSYNFKSFDVIGILSSVGLERVYERNLVATKFKVIELESNGIKLGCMIFGPYVEALDAFLQSGCNGNVVV